MCGGKCNKTILKNKPKLHHYHYKINVFDTCYDVKCTIKHLTILHNNLDAEMKNGDRLEVEIRGCTIEAVEVSLSFIALFTSFS